MNIWTRNVRVAVWAVAASVVACTAVALVVAGLFHGKGLRYKSQAAMLAAMPATATTELTSHGLALTAPLSCWIMPEAAPSKLRVACAGQTVRGKHVQVLGAAEERRKEQFFTILVEGRPLLQNAACLGTDCRPKHA